MALSFSLTLVLGDSIYEPVSDLHCINKTCGLVYREPAAINCRQFAVCIKEIIHTIECPIGFSFNPTDGACDTTYNHMCEEDSICPLGIEIVVYPKIGSCSEYYECKNGTITVKQCTIGLEFNADTDKCEQPTGKCILCPKEDDPTNKIITFRSENSCNQ